MKNVLICNSKGGVGKSLIVDELAFSFERTDTPYNFYDLDNQGGTIHKTKRNESAIVSIIDTPGALNEQLAQWITSAHLVIIPTRTTSRDIEPLKRMIEIVSTNNKDCPIIYVLNAYNRFKASSDFTEWLSKQVHNTILALPQSELFVQASAYSKSIVEYAPKSKVALATIELCNKVKEYINIQLE